MEKRVSWREKMGGEAPAIPEIDQAAAADGEMLYQANCAVCHGADLAGAPDWKVPDENGQYKPPPMDSSGHTWHHSDQLLTDIVLNGSPDEKSAMRGIYPSSLSYLIYFFFLSLLS